MKTKELRSNELQTETGRPKHPVGSNLQGFDTEFADLPDYIRIITDRIWEGRQIEAIHQYYSDPCIVETPLGVSTARIDVVVGTRATLQMFPDRRLLAEDVIVSGSATHGFLSSHRIISPMTHLGDGSFGAATSKVVHARTIADCVCKDNRIIHEWLVRDHAAIAIGLGTTPKDLAARWVKERGGWKKQIAGPAPAGYQSSISEAPLAKRYATMIKQLAQANLQTDLQALYDSAVHHIGPGETHRYGIAEVNSFWRQLFSAFRVEQFTIEHLIENTDSARGTRVAVRWRAIAKHEAQGTHGQQFGTASHRTVEIMGINHVELVNGAIQREWVLIDEVALWMQVL